MKKLFLVSSVCLLNLVGFHCYAAPSSNSPETNNQSSSALPADTWYSQPKAIIRVLNKLESGVNILTIPVGGSAQYKTLTIMVKNCVSRPATLSPDSAAFVTVTDSKLSTPPFSAWIFVAEPGASVFEHPLYNVSLSGCSGELSNKPLEIKQENKTEGKAQNPSNDLEQSLENSIQSQH